MVKNFQNKENNLAFNKSIKKIEKEKRERKTKEQDFQYILLRRY